MNSTDVLLICIGAIAVIGTYTWWWTSRLDRLHYRADVTRASLEAQLLRRAGLAARIAGSGALDPASSLVVADCANRAILAHGAVSDPELWRCESELTAVLREALGENSDLGQAPSAGNTIMREDVRELADAWERAAMAKTFYNDAVQDVLRLRSNPLIQFFRLAGRTPLPEPAALDLAPS